MQVPVQFINNSQKGGIKEAYWRIQSLVAKVNEQLESRGGRIELPADLTHDPRITYVPIKKLQFYQKLDFQAATTSK